MYTPEYINTVGWYGTVPTGTVLSTTTDTIEIRTCMTYTLGPRQKNRLLAGNTVNHSRITMLR